MTKVKICGLMRPEDIDALNEARADFAGFVFAPGRHQMMPGNVRSLVEKLSPGILPVGVFVDEQPKEIADIALYCRLGAVQLHGMEDNAYISKLRRMLRCGVQVIQAVRVKDAESLDRASASNCDLLLLDAFTNGVAGGTGTSFDWSLLMGFECPFLLAGGLSERNLQDVLERFHPYGVDVSSGVETDGAKDKDMITRFINLARSFE